MIPRRLVVIAGAILFLSWPCHAQKSKSAAKTKEAVPHHPVYLSAQDKIKLPSGQEISVSEIVPRTDDALKQLQQIANAVKSPALQSAAISLTELNRRVQETKPDADNAIRLARSSLQITDLRVQWKRDHNQLEGIRSTITDFATLLEQSQTQLAGMKEMWVYLAGPQFAKRLDPDLVQRISIVVGVIQGLEKDIHNQSDVLVKLQVMSVETGAQIDDTLEQLTQAETAFKEQLFVIDSPPFLSALKDTDYREAWRRILVVAGSSGSRLGYFYRANRSNLLLFLLFSIGLWILVAKLGKTAVPSSVGGVDPKAFECLKQPLAVAAVLALLLVPVVFSKAPIDFQRLCRLLAVLPVTHLAIAMLHRKLHPYIGGLGIAFSVNVASIQVSSGTIFRRIICLILTVAIAAALVRLLAKDGLLTTFFADRKSAVVPLFLRIGTFLLILSILSEIVGNTSLSDLLANGTIFSMYYALSTYVFFSVFIALTAAFVESSFGQRSRAFRLHADLIDRTVSSYLTVAGWVAWIAISLFSFQIFHEAFGSVSEVLHDKWEIGAISISLLDVVLFCLVLFGSTQIAKLIRFLLNEEILPRTNINAGVAQAGTRLTYIALLSLGVFLALGAAGLELSKLTVLTGAFGVGLGFGMQNVVGNFVSGIILSLERPVQIGDMVDINTLSGEVRAIGFRSSTIRTFDGADVIVPNSELITKSVVNWSLTDYLRRTDIAIGVAYGTDPQRVVALLNEIVKAHPQVVRPPEPLITFDLFGESSLDFTLRFWSRLDQRLQIRSELNTKIAAEFEKNGIVIAFPQRDVHLHLDQNGSSDLPTKTVRRAMAGE